jgi:hypothetical protein
MQQLSGVIDRPGTARLFLREDFDREQLWVLLGRFRGAIKRQRDHRLADDLRNDLLSNPTPRLRTSTIRRLASWCKTSGIYADGMEVAKDVSVLLFGQVLDRTRLDAGRRAILLHGEHSTGRVF